MKQVNLTLTLINSIYIILEKYYWQFCKLKENVFFKAACNKSKKKFNFLL